LAGYKFENFPNSFTGKGSGSLSFGEGWGEVTQEQFKLFYHSGINLCNNYLDQVTDGLNAALSQFILVL